ncbi:hypothetical protein C4D60_Mb05t07260 [Musa balbisiana]|uniref:Uncharacterized protein n=1 Tax=Musa balbisiana TaxID=52838 RepID=A0A4S8JUC7_MUSBA|nr:hypothetical protein C4D60_Mb05t07260 [Musa balbisiana]
MARLWTDVLEKARAQAGVLKGLFGRLAEILRECPGQYYRWAYSLWRVGMKYDLRRVEEVYYDVKIRGLGSGDWTHEEAVRLR